MAMTSAQIKALLKIEHSQSIHGRKDLTTRTAVVLSRLGLARFTGGRRGAIEITEKGMARLESLRSSKIIPRCKHKFKFVGRRGRFEFYFRCRCGARRTRVPTKAEAVWCSARDREAKLDAKRGAHIHTLFHRFQSKFWDESAHQYKLRGYKFMVAVEQFARHNLSVVLCQCDDSAHTGSLIVLIPHETEDEYWGTTVVTIPQHDEPSEMFLYPHHLKGVLSALTGLAVRTEQKNKPRRKKHVWTPSWNNGKENYE